MKTKYSISLITVLLLIIGLTGGCEFLQLDPGLAVGAEGAARCPQVQLQPVSGGKSLVTWVPSEAAPDRGIVVRLIYPDRPRYPVGTAAVIEVPGADTPGDVELPRRAIKDPLVEQGLIKVAFAFPGGGRPPLQSGGIYDHRGLNSLKTLRAVVRFLNGELQDTHNCTVSELLPYAITQVGLIGSSNGGNTAVVALGLFGDEMDVDWYVGWENPAGVQFTTVDLGSHDRPNPAYIPGSCRLTPEGAKCDVDYSRLRWDPEVASRGWGPQRRGERGVLYHDLNNNNRYDEGDYTLGAYIGSFAGREKRVYSTAALAAAVTRGLLEPWPEGVATLEEAREFWAIRDMSRYYADVIRKRPELRAIVIGSIRDHVQATPDYPHIVLQYQGWQAAGIQWVRLNPDAVYVQVVASQAAVADNDANITVDYGNIIALLEPEDVPDRLIRAAAALELSDRVSRQNWQANLDRSLIRLTSGSGAALELPHSVARLADGHTLITDGSSGPPDRHGKGPRGGKILEVDSSGEITWSYAAGLDFPHQAELSLDGKRLLIADTGHDRVLEVERATGQVLWDSRKIKLDDGSTLRYPNDVNYLPDGHLLITDRDNHRVLIIDRSGRVLWQFGETGVPGSDERHLWQPHNADLLSNNDIIVADSKNNRVLEISPVGQIIWEYRPQGAEALNWPRDADRLPNGNTLITDSRNNRVIEVTPDGGVVWEFKRLKLPYEADRLENGNTLIADSGNKRVIEVNPQGQIVWSYPPEAQARADKAQLQREQAWVRDEERHRIYTAWWRPPGEGPFPAVVFVAPIGPGVPALRDPAFRQLAQDGFVVASFNAEGRGREGEDKSEGEETCQGPNQQEDLKAVVEHLAALPYVNADNIGVISFSGGSLLAGPALGRWPEMPVAYWVDGEGPHDGSIILREACGHPSTQVDPSPENRAFWRERAPIEFIARFRGHYLRVQAEIDHAQGNYHKHALLMNNAAVEGEVLWVRINGEDVGNPVNRVYPLDDPARWPRWLPGRLRDQPGGAYGVLARYARELAALISSERPAQALPHFKRASEGPVLGPGEAEWESVDVLSAEVLYDPSEGLFKMWYTGFDGRRYAIGYATSRDGLRWERYPGNPVLASTGGEWDREGVGFPAVIRVDDKYYMYFTLLKQARAHRDAAIGLAISEDGVHWERVGDGPILLPGAAGDYDARALVGPEVFIDDGGTWHLLYAGGRDYPGDNDGRWAILHATSSDGLSWQVDPEPVLTGDVVGLEDALNPEVLQLPDGSYWLAFAARVEHSHFHLFLARSADGVKWQLVSRGELLKPGKPSHFDEKAINHPALVLHDGKLYLFYTGYDRRNRRAIGLATAPISAAP